MCTEIPVKITRDLGIPGEGPIVIIGPNGAGKTRLGNAMLSLNPSAGMIAALRNIALSEDIPLQSFDQAERNLARSYGQRKTKHWTLSNEIDQLFSKLMVKNSTSAVAFRDEHLNGNAPPQGHHADYPSEVVAAPVSRPANQFS